MASDEPGFDDSLLIVDDFALNRRCLATELGRHYAEVRTASSLPSLFRESESSVPRLILLNFSMRDSLKILRVCLNFDPQPRVIVYGLADEWDVTTCAEAGASGLHLRFESLDDLITLMREVLNGRAHCSAEVSSLLLGQVYAAAGGGVSDPTLGSLTTREVDILTLLEEGLTNQQIASRLSLTVSTVKNHVHSLLSKLNVNSRAEAARVARAMRYTGPKSSSTSTHTLSR